MTASTTNEFIRELSRIMRQKTALRDYEPDPTIARKDITHVAGLQIHHFGSGARYQPTGAEMEQIEDLQDRIRLLKTQRNEQQDLIDDLKKQITQLRKEPPPIDPTTVTRRGSKLTHDQRLEILKLYNEGMTLTGLSKRYNISYQLVYQTVTVSKAAREYYATNKRK